MSDIFSALDYNNLSRLDELLTAGADVNRRDSDNKTVLHKACETSNLAAIKLILRHKPNVNLRDNWGGTPLIIATHENHVEIVKLLLSHGADPYIEASRYKSTPLRNARSGEIVTLLIDNGANIDAKASDNATPLIWASGYGHLSTVKGLCGHGVDVNQRGGRGQTALHNAADQGQIDTVRFLLTQKPDVSLVDVNFCTALDKAKYKGYKDIVDLITNYTEREKHINKGKFFICHALKLH